MGSNKNSLGGAGMLTEIEKEIKINEMIATYCAQVGACSNCKFWRYGCKAEDYFTKMLDKTLEVQENENTNA